MLNKFNNNTINDNNSDNLEPEEQNDKKQTDNYGINEVQRLKEKLMNCQIELKEERNKNQQLQEALKEKAIKDVDFSKVNNDTDSPEQYLQNKNVLNDVELFNILHNRTYII